jgi:thiol-disulfide isomerase/thioredoxin
VRIARLAGWAGLLFVAIWQPGAPLASSPSDKSTPRQLVAAASAATPAFELSDLSGSPLKLQDRAGRIVLVHFFATWCEPCRDELSSLSRLADGPLGKRVAVVGVNVVEVPARVRRFLDAAPVSFPVVLDADRAVTRAWSVGMLPTTFVLDRHLQARLFVEGDVDWSRPDIVAALEALDQGTAK